MKIENFIKLQPIDIAIERPLWSVIIPTYNCAEFLKETLQSVLLQDPGEDQMEVIVVDDHSTKDNPEEVVNALGKGRIKFIRQPKNVGKVRNYETGLASSCGYYIHQLHGDDMVRPGFYQTMTALFEKHPKAGAAFCRTIYIDDQSRWTGITGMIQDMEGIVPDMVAKLYTQQHIQTPAMVVKREVYETIGSFDRRLNCMEDWEMWIRIANSYQIVTSNEVLSAYRSHGSNATHLTFKDGSALTTHQLVCDIVDSYIKPEIIINYKKLRDKKQAAFWLLSYKNLKHRLSYKQRLQIAHYIMCKNFNLKNIYKLFS